MCHSRQLCTVPALIVAARAQALPASSAVDSRLAPTPFIAGQTGPRAHLPGYASVCEAFGGFRYINGYEDRAPVRPNISLGDSLAGLHAAFGTVMALLHRVRAGGGAAGQVRSV